MGKDNYINGRLSVILSEQKHVIFGSECAISFGVWVRTADPHLVYDAETKQRLNPSKSVFVGDHVWIGQSVMLLKGTQISSGSIIGAGSVVAGKRIPANTAWAGNPARQVKEGIFWSGQCVHRWRDKETEEFQSMRTDKYIFDTKAYMIFAIDDIERKLTAYNNVEERLKYFSFFEKKQEK